MSGRVPIVGYDRLAVMSLLREGSSSASLSGMTSGVVCLSLGVGAVFGPSMPNRSMAVWRESLCPWAMAPD